MKKQIIAILALIVVSIILPMSSLAMTYQEWTYECRCITTGTVTLYALDIADDGTKTPRAIGSLPAGTYFIMNGYDYDVSMKRIAYYSNGDGVRAYIEHEAPIRDAVARIFFTDGSGDFIPEAVYKDPAALQSYLKRLYPGKKLNGDGRNPVSIDGALPLEQQENPVIPTSVPAKDPSTDTSGHVEGEWTDTTEVSEEEQAFNATCGRRLKRTVWGYSDAHMTKKYEEINIGTYCDIVTDFNDVVKIAYYKNGEKHEAHIERADLVGSYTQYTSQDGTVQGWISTADPNYAAVIAENVVDYEAEDIQSDLNSQVAAEQAGQTSKKVSVTTIGVANSTIVVDRKNREIPTSELSFGTEVPEGKQIAVIHAPKSGKCSLHKTSSNSSKVLKKCKAGTVVVVLEYGSNKCKINYNGTVGYVATNCLKFYGTDVQTEGIGTLTYKGKATGKTTINIHNTPDKGSATIADWKTGTKVTVFGHENGWYEIEYKGKHGYVMDKFLTIGE